MSRPTPTLPLNNRSDLLNLEPDIPVCIPRIDILAIRHASHVE